MKTLVLNWQQQAQAFWQQRAPRERRALQILGAVLLGALVVQLAWSLASSRQKLLRQMPELAATAEQSDRLYEAWQQLTAANAARPLPRPEVLRQAVEQRLGELGPKLVARWNGNGELLLEGRTDFARWLTWTAAMQQENRLLLQRVRLQPGGDGVVVDAVFAFAATAP